jgi:hypothetical protein
VGFFLYVRPTKAVIKVTHILFFVNPGAEKFHFFIKFPVFYVSLAFTSGSFSGYESALPTDWQSGFVKDPHRYSFPWVFVVPVT